ncbi:MAG: PP2C family protein-serine/threonine phosphatase, partial [Candidatus Aminicenantales bacterium]
LFTDGITESRNRENKEFEENRLVRILKKNVKKPTEDLVEKVFAELASYTSGAEPMDDMTLVLIKRQPQGPKRKKK